MCCWCKKEKQVNSVHSYDGEAVSDNTYNDYPEHVDNALLNGHIRKGVLGFRYENKTCMFIVYTSVEAKTFCMIMHLKLIKY